MNASSDAMAVPLGNFVTSEIGQWICVRARSIFCINGSDQMKLGKN